MFIKKNLNFLLADDHTIVRKGMSLLIEELIENPIIYNSSTIFETLSILEKNKVDVLILDINFPEGTTISFIPEIKIIYPNVKILIFSALEEDIYALRYINAGANGFLNKLSTEQEMKSALSEFLLKGKYITKNIKDKILDKYMYKKMLNPLDQLSDRENEIARLLVKGHSNFEICLMKRIQPTTVSTYKKRIFEKLNIDNLVSLIEILNSYDDDIN
ncbi:response regulator transcription factor [Flavobacterium sp. SUN052]|uniref:response regulator transcription factor n=1 Tax=Flavobacterium sp. SUN052 TaxID=3002441 RepID=UPI00237EC191|nr:response regulator transcription factor [Flavobacterium sp. SUN052]MEC4004997.1 response regulator transcription factor [Flavobacterium sp. SUN052]